MTRTMLTMMTVSLLALSVVAPLGEAETQCNTVGGCGTLTVDVQTGPYDCPTIPNTSCFDFGSEGAASADVGAGLMDFRGLAFSLPISGTCAFDGIFSTSCDDEDNPKEVPGEPGTVDCIKADILVEFTVGDDVDFEQSKDCPS